jgi:transcriptional regulator with XRE-family HTH domain
VDFGFTRDFRFRFRQSRGVSADEWQACQDSRRPRPFRTFGYAVCQVAGISRAKLSDIERGYVAATAEDLRAVDAAIDGIIATRRHLTKLAEEAGLSLTGVRL